MERRKLVTRTLVGFLVRSLSPSSGRFEALQIFGKQDKVLKNFSDDLFSNRSQCHFNFNYAVFLIRNSPAFWVGMCGKAPPLSPRAV